MGPDLGYAAVSWCSCKEPGLAMGEDCRNIRGPGVRILARRVLFEHKSPGKSTLPRPCQPPIN